MVPAEEVDGDPRGGRLLLQSRRTGESPWTRRDPSGNRTRHGRKAQTSRTWRPL
jgi:hypothetical protein